VEEAANQSPAVAALDASAYSKASDHRPSRTSLGPPREKSRRTICDFFPKKPKAI
jgi:hypothetical protein